MTPITVDELATEIAEGRAPVLLDVRWQLGDTQGHAKYLAGHVPGAVYVDLDTELAAPASAAAGRHPLPDLADLQAAARAWGISEGDRVVAYDAVGNTAAARAWWLLRWAGIAEVTLLDGGYPAWVAAGRAVETGERKPEPGDVVLTAGGMPVTDADGAAELAHTGVLLDARATERYLGRVEPVDPRAGHIPGARSLPTGGNLDESGHFLPVEALRERFAATEGTTVGVYCGSGVTASHQVFALELAGIPAVLYPGSWSQWSNDPERPVATED
jgi:thiosulfate/3-mercaptopyruvate sulfurtransferase